MGDGRVALILDLIGLVEHGKIAALKQTEAGSQQQARDDRQDLQTLLVLEAGKQRFAIPMDKVARLEEFAQESVEVLGGERFIQYRDDILPLIDLAQFVGLCGGETAAAHWQEETLQVVVCSTGDEMVGLRVDRIVDVVEEEAGLRKRGKRPGILGTTVLQQRVTDLVDVSKLFDSVRVAV